MEYSDNDVVGLFFDVVKLDRRHASQHKKVDPFRGQYRCMLALSYEGSIDQKRLAALLQVRSTSLSELLSKLECKGLIKRSPSDADKRTFLVSLTEKGLTVAEECNIRRAKEHSKMLEVLSENEKEQFYCILEKIKNCYLKEEKDKNV